MLSGMTSVATPPRVLDGIAIAAEIKSEVALRVATALGAGYQPGLAVVLVGEVPASQIYVRSKVKTCAELGIYSEMHTPAATATTEELLALVDSLNRNDTIDGILIQLPLPAHVDTARLLEAVIPAKDVDGFHPINAGRLLSGAPASRCLRPALLRAFSRSCGAAGFPSPERARSCWDAPTSWANPSPRCSSTPRRP